MKKTKPARGRPQTFDRKHVLEVAMMNYWSGGGGAVSVAEICRLANVSKPGLYREFGSEDGLKQAVLTTYFDQVLGALFNLLEQDRPFLEVTSDLIDLISQDRSKTSMPDGCLLLGMTQISDQLGPMAQGTAQNCRVEMLKKFEDWISKAKESGELKTTITDHDAAIYVNAQVNAATELQKNGETTKVIRSFLQLALSVFLPIEKSKE